MSLKFSSENRTGDEILICILNIGLTTCIKEGLINIEEAENFLYSPYSMEKLKDQNIDNRIIDLIHLGCELENVERLIPEKLDSSIENIKEKAFILLKELPHPELPTKKWID